MDKTHEQVEKRLIALAYAKDFDEVMEERMVLTLSLSDSVANEAKHMILRYQKLLPPSTVQYIGIAKDEQERLLRLAGNRVSLLDKYNCTEEDAKQLCQRAGLLSPVYTFTTRGGCWFCPNAKRKELRHLYDYHPNLWERMLELQALPNKVSEKFNRSETFSDIDAEFRLEDAQESLFQNAA